MKNLMRTFFIFSAVLLSITACQFENDGLNEVELLSKSDIAITTSTDTDCDHVHWSYTGPEGPEFWKDLCPGWSDCNGTTQSPINISRAYIDEDLSRLRFSYNSTLTNIVNNGHTVQFNVDNGSGLYINRKKYDLLQFHYHGLSEHQILGNHYPLEVHFVHKADDGNLAVVGIFFKKGHENDLFANFLEHFPHHEGSYTSMDMIELVDLLPKSPNYFTYSGSLTTPPCSEIVTWFVMREPIEASASQIDDFSEILHNNYRPVQPLNGRNVYAYINDNDD